MVVVTHSSWHEPPRIRHQVTQQLSRFTRVFYVETPANWRRITKTSVEEVAPNVTRVVLGNPHLIPRRVHHWIDSLWTRLNRHYVDEIAALPRLGPSPLLITFNFDLIEAIDSGLFSLTAYFCNDVFVTFATDRLAAAAIVRREEAMARSADLCFTVSTVLARELERWNPRTTLLLPGHDLRERIRTSRRPGAIRIGYMGYLDRRLHYDWLLAAAAAGVDVHLIGPIAGDSAGLRLLRSKSLNVTLHGAKVGEEMQDTLLDMDVLVLPYSTEGTGMLPMTAPNKLFAYLACGKPIVASNLPHLLQLDAGLVYVTATAEEFVAAIQRAVHEDSDTLREKRLTLARANRWDSRGDELRVLLEHELERKEHSDHSIGTSSSRHSASVLSA